MAIPLIVPADPPRAEQAVALLLRAIGEDPERDGLKKTPERVARAMTFLTSGSVMDPVDVLNGAIFDHFENQMVVVRDIEFSSLCERHLLPFHGNAHVAYLPEDRVIDPSRLPRLLDVIARRLQVQERLTDQVARAVQRAIEPRGVAVHIEAAHQCLMMRGVARRQTVTLTASFLGDFDGDLKLRAAFYAALGASPIPVAGGPRDSRGEGRPEHAEGHPAELRLIPRSRHRAARTGVLAGGPTPGPQDRCRHRIGPRPGKGDGQ